MYQKITFPLFFELAHTRHLTNFKMAENFDDSDNFRDSSEVIVKARGA